MIRGPRDDIIGKLVGAHCHQGHCYQAVRSYEIMQADEISLKLNAVQRSGLDPNTIFVEILAGRLPASFVHRDDLVSAFMDIQPVTPGHVLVVPNVRAATLAELSAETGAQMFRIGQRVAAALRQADIACEGVNFFLADGVAAGQSVFHLHLHVFPRYAGDDFAFKLPDRYYTPPAREELARIGGLISGALGRTPADG